MKNKLLLSLALVFGLQSSAYALPIEIGTRYNLNGTVGTFDEDRSISRDTLTNSSSYSFGTDGIFNLYFVTDEGHGEINLAYDEADFLDGGTVTLNRFSADKAEDIIGLLNGNFVNSGFERDEERIALDANNSGGLSSLDALIHINGVNEPARAGTVVSGIYVPNATGLAGATRIALSMNGVFRLSDLPTLSIWNKQFSTATNSQLGGTDFHLQAGTTEVPEPATAMLLGGGLLAGFVRKRKAKA